MTGRFGSTGTSTTRPETLGTICTTKLITRTSFVEGVVSVRGQVIPAVSLRTRFGFDRAEHDLRSRLIVVRSRGRTVGLVVDSAREFASIPADGIGPLPEGIGGASRRYLRGVAQRGDRLVLVVDVPELLALDVLPTDPVPPTPPPDAAPHGAST